MVRFKKIIAIMLSVSLCTTFTVGCSKKEDNKQEVEKDKLKDIEINYKKEEAVCVMLTSGGYPEDYEKGKVITGLEDLDEDIVVFHSGTKMLDGNLVTNGGRVIGITTSAGSVEEAAKKVYKNIEKINFEGMHYRTDIGIKFCEEISF